MKNLIKGRWKRERWNDVKVFKTPNRLSYHHALISPVVLYTNTRAVKERSFEQENIPVKYDCIIALKIKDLNYNLLISLMIFQRLVSQPGGSD